MINNNPNNNLIADIRKAQQARYDREDKSILDALSQANAYLSAQYNLDEEVKQLWNYILIQIILVYISKALAYHQTYHHGYWLALFVLFIQLS